MIPECSRSPDTIERNPLAQLGFKLISKIFLLTIVKTIKKLISKLQFIIRNPPLHLYK